MPAWLIVPLFDTPDGTLYGSGLDMKVALGTLGLACYCFLPKRTLPLRLAPLDFLFLGLIAVHVVSDYRVSGATWMIPARAYAEWYLPYLLGRLACQSFEDMRWVAYSATCVAILLGIVAVLEAFAGVNLFEAALGDRPIEGFNRNASRWGIKRAFGPAMHPIYLGVVGVLLLGWSSFLSISALRKRVNALWLFAPVPVVLLVATTGSRGPILAMVIASFGYTFMTWRKLRLPIVGIAILVAGLLAANREYVLGELERWGKGGREVKTTELSIGDEKIVHSGLRNRLSIISVYGIAVKRSGLLGFGTDAVSTFPINVPVGPRELETLKETRYIDNTYLLLTLRFGYLGAAMFATICVLAVVQLIGVADRHRGRSPSILACCLGGSLLGVYAAIATVWMPPDYGFLLVWTMGCSSGMYLTMRAGGFGKPTGSDSIQPD